MGSCSKEVVQAVYRRLVKVAREEVEKKKWDSASDYLSSAAKWAYQFNLFFRDEEAEALIKKIGADLLGSTLIDSPEENNYAFIDSFCLDNRGLTQQYLRAMMQSGAGILYICTAKTINSGEDILQELGNYPKAKILSFIDGDYNIREVAEKMVDCIRVFSPGKIFLHISPWDVAALIFCSSIRGAKVFNINLTDHAYWMGASLIDYNIEFRPYGMTVSLEKRGLKREQILALPFYPVDPLGHPFRGFPEMPDDAIKVFTGGSLYKILGKDDIFFHLMEDLLSLANNVFILVAGFSNEALFNEKCARVKGNERILQIGFRDDIDAVFKHCDVFLSTYPVSGGLMCQYAAKCGKPVLAYREPQDQEGAVEEMLNHFGNDARSFTDRTEFMNYARKLFSDGLFRQQEGESLRNGLMNPEQFFNSFKTMMSSLHSQWMWKPDIIDYETFSNHYLALENENGFPATEALLKTHRFHLLWRMKGCNVYLVNRAAAFMCRKFSRIIHKRKQ